MKKIILSQNTAVNLTGAAVLVLLALWLPMYRSAGRSINQLRSELTATENQIRQIEAGADKGLSLRERGRSFDTNAQPIDSQFPQQKEESLRLLSEFARKLNIEIVSLRSQPTAACLDIDKKKIAIEGMGCQRLSVSVELRGSYKDLLKYIETLKESLPAYFTAEKLRMAKDISGASRLNITLELNLYLLS